MERWIGIILIVAAIWGGVEYFTKGDQAFGGILARGEAPAEPEPWAGARAGAKLERAHADRDEKLTRTFGD